MMDLRLVEIYIITIILKPFIGRMMNHMASKSRVNTAPPSSAVAYLRFSSKNQRSESLDAQERACREYADRHQLNIVKVYADAAKSGTNSERDAFQEMIRESGEGLFQVLLIHKLDRFSRSKHDAVVYKSILKANGVRVVSVTENLDDSAESVVLESVLEGMNAYYSLNLSREVKKGMFESARKCMHLGGCPPLGFDVDPLTKQYKINPEEAELVRLIFRLYADGMGAGRILEYLNGMNYRTKRGGTFGKNSLTSMMGNEKYIGRYVFNKMQEKDLAGRRNPQVRPREEWIIVENGIPAIVDEETFNIVQERMMRNKRYGGQFKAKRPYLLSGLIVCGMCNSSMCGNTRKTGGRDTYYSSYRCSKRDSHQDCKNREVNKDCIENYVLDELYKKLLSETSIRDLASRLHAYNQKKATASNDELSRTRKELTATNGKIQNVVRLVSESGVSIDTVKEELKRLEDRKCFLEDHIREAEVVCEGTATISEEMITSLISKSAEYVKTKDIPECKNFIHSYIEKVVVGADSIRILFKIGVPDDNLGSIVPMQSSEDIETIRRAQRKSA